MRVGEWLDTEISADGYSSIVRDDRIGDLVAVVDKVAEKEASLPGGIGAESARGQEWRTPDNGEASAKNAE